MLGLLNIGPLEWIVLLGGAVLLFGGDLPGVVRKLAQVLGRLRAMASDLSREVDLHGRYEQPPESLRTQLPPPPVDFADADPVDFMQADEFTDTEDHASSESDTAPELDPRERDTPADHSNWEPESGADKPSRLDDDEA
ncbi:MAG: hypothetical protein DHS20C15_18250 [Planctomycetota bacterium]|nr:MAG: hypothetical protein DHS20C15_18250 [Planctomycetota bacterium]